MSKIKEFKKELKELLKKYNVSLEVNIEGDTHGISTDFVAVFNPDGAKHQGWEEHILSECCSDLNAYDL